ncbi:MAG: polyprenyl synthetase family protein [Elusimicrobia bacterium]|nr:polyprenyl synthetase family protein [Elusimicrobiota bacterium]
MTNQLKEYLQKWKKIVDQALNNFLPPASSKPILKAMRYSVFAGGKRLRPILAIAGAEICNLDGKKALPTACALEMIHTYSLIHDDLPAMDDDDLRRGRPTSHKVFGEGIAILAGDALLTYAFDLIAKNGKMLGQNCRLAFVVESIAQGAGFKGMVGGQALDLEMDEGRWLKQKPKKQIEILKKVHESKTASLIEASLVSGAFLANASQDKIKKLLSYGKKIGLAFQIADDILDLIGDKKLLGKKGSDLENKKLTFPAIFGIEKSKSKATQLIQEAKEELKIFGKKAQILKDLADYIVERTY